MLDKADPQINEGEGADTKLGQVRVSDIHPSPENDLLYKPIDQDDPEFVALVASVKQFGVKSPLTITADHFIISGHRRHAAACRAGLPTVPCVVESVRRADYDSDGFMVLLREHNRQRVKSFDEVIREEVVSADPAEVIQRVKAYRRSKCKVEVEAIEIGDETKSRCEISEAKMPFLMAVSQVILGLKDFLPVTIRQIHYGLLNDPPLKHAGKPGSRYKNDVPSYKDLSNLVMRARLTGAISWEAIDDPTRPVVDWPVHRAPGVFVKEQMADFLQGYYRNLQQSQPCHIEIVGEKNTIRGVIHDVAWQYCIPYTLGRGYSSATPRKEMGKRFLASGKDRLILLIMSDFDPEGEDIAHSFAWSMRDEFGVSDLRAIKVALTENQIEELQLHPQMKAKKGSSRRAKFVDKFGENVWELEAVPPAQLQQILRKHILDVMDLDAFNHEEETEEADVLRLDAFRKRVVRTIRELPAA